MRLLTKYSLISVAALALVVGVIAIVGVRAFDNINRTSHVRLLDVPLAAAANEIDEAIDLADDARIWAILNYYESRHGMPLLAYRDTGRRIYPTEEPKSRIADADIERMLKTPQGSGWVDTAPERYLTAWRVLDGGNILLIAERSEAVVFEGRSRYLTGIAAGVAIVLLVGAIVSMLLSRSFGRRVTETLDTLDALSRGEFDARVPVRDGGDELSVLQRRINEMSGLIAKRARERESATRWLEESESRFRDFAESTADAFWETDADLRYTWFNNQGLAFPGSETDNEMIGRKRGEFFVNIRSSSGDWDGHLDDLENRRPFRNFQFSGIDANGDIFHRVSSGGPYFEDDGTFAGYRGTTSDITERIETERRLSNLVSNVPGLVFQRLIYPDDSVGYAYLSGDTGRYFASTAFDDVDAAAKNMNYVHPDDRERVRAAFIEGARSGKPSSIEFRHIMPSGETEWIQLNNAAAYKRPDGVLVQDGFSVSVTALKTAQHEANVARERLLGFMRTASDTLWETDSEHRLLWLSDPDDLSIRHIENEEMIGRRRWEYPHVVNPDGQNWQRHRADLENRKPFRDFEFEVRRKDGMPIFRRISGQPVYDENGEFIGYRGISADITERVMAERAARTEQQRLIDAIQTSNQGLALFDADDRLVFVNETYRLLQPEYADLFVVGARFGDIIRMIADRGNAAAESEGIENWIERRLAYHAEPDGVFTTVEVNDRFVEVTDERLSDGGAIVRLMDVTTQTEARRALQSSEARFRDFAEASSDWLWETDADFRFLWHSADNDPNENNGVTAKGRTPWDYLGVDVERKEDFQSLLNRMLAREPFRDFRYPKVLADGSVTYRSTSGVPYFDSDGAFLGYRGTTTDITEQVEAEQRYRNLIEQTPTPMLVHDRKSIKFANSAAIAMFGAETEEELIRRSVFDLIPAADHDFFHQRLDSIIDRGEATPLSEQRRTRLDGREIIVMSRGVPVMWEGQRAVLGTQIDITDRVVAEEQYRDLIQNAPMALTIDNGRQFLFANQAFADLIGAESVDDVIGRPLTDMAHPEDLEAFHDRVRTVSSLRQKLSTSEIKRQRFDGSEVTVLSRAVPVAWQGELATLGMQIDISDRIEAQLALRDSEERFRNLVEGSRQGVLLHVDFKPVFANAVAAEMFGYDSVDEILELDNVLELVAPEERETWREYRTMRLSGLPAPESYEFAGVRKDGSRIWLHVTVRIVAWEGRTALQGTMIDITPQRDALETIRDSEERFRVLTAMSPVGIFVTDANGRFEYINEAYQNMSGLTLDAASGQGWLDAVHPSDRDRIGREWDAAISGQGSFRTELRFQRPDGAVVWGIAQGAPQRDASGNIVNFIGAVTDVTARRETEQALESSEERFRMLTMLSPAGVFLTSAEGQVEYVNGALARMLGMPAREATGRKWVDGIHPEDKRKLLTAWREAFENFDDLEIEIRMGPSDGEMRWTFVQASPLRLPGGDVGGYVGAVTDITDRKVAEEQVRQVHKMEAVGQLTGGIAHDFNNLLAIVQGNLELLSERAPDEDRIQGLIEAAHGATRRGAALNQRLLAFARRQPLRPANCDINEIVGGMAELFERTLGDNVSMRSEYAAGLWRARIDPNGLETAILNLAINARDAMPEGGTLTLTTSNLKVAEGKRAPSKDMPAGDYVLLQVTDSGTGMDPETLEKAFDPFFTTKGVGKGSGLGLSMVYGFAHQSGGLATIESVPGTGTSITLYFPRADAEEDVSAASRRPAPVAPPGGGENILVVEDDEHVLDMAVGMFESLNYTPFVASCAEEAMRILDENGDIELLFTDVVLGNGETGPDLARRARERHPGLRILFTSGYTNDQLDGSSEIELGALLNKPYQKPDLARAVRAALDTVRA